MSACMFGSAHATLSDPIGISSQSASNPYGALFGGVQAGWEYVFPSRLMLGIEADISFPNYEEASKVLSYRATPTGYASEEYEWLASLRGRVGYDIGAWTPYLTGGIAWMSTRYSRIDLTTGNEDANPANVRVGWTAGAGLDYRLDSRWSARAEYLYTNFNLSGFAFGSAPSRYDTQYDLHRVRFGLNYRFGEVEEKKTKSDDRGPGSFEFHGQTVFVYQGYPPINAPYDGTNSLPAVGQSRETWGMSAFLGVRLWEGGELYYNPELLQGYGVALTTGAGGFPNGEAQRAFPYPRYNTSRLFVRQTFGLGGEREKVESDLGQLARRTRHLAHHRSGGQVRRAGRLRQQQVRQRSARRFPQLGAVVGRRVRLPGRQRRLQLGHHRRAEPARLGGARRAVPGRQPAQHRRL